MGRHVVRAGHQLIVGADAPVGAEAARVVGTARIDGELQARKALYTGHVLTSANPYAQTATDLTIEVNTTAATSVNLLAAALWSGKHLWIVDGTNHANAHPCIIQASGAELIGGFNTDSISVDGGYRHYYCDGTKVTRLAAG